MSGTVPPIPPPLGTNSGNAASPNICTITKAMWNDLILAHQEPSDRRDTKIAALRLKFNAFKALEAEVNATFVNSLPRKWLSMSQTQRANNSIKSDSLATLFGKYNYEEGLIDQIYELETSRFSIQASSSKALISNTHLQDNNSYVEEDTRSNSEFLADLNDEFHDKALFSNQKSFYKRSRRDEESVSSDDERDTRVKEFMSIAEDEPSVGKTDARS
ncbi:hypothetical protein Tco_0837879, partial [Tanacetum coccineum]